jgi:protease-4
MALDTEAVIDRRRTRRRLIFWRFAAIVFALLLIAAVSLSSSGMQGEGSFLPHVARVKITGLITDDQKMTDLLDRLRRSSQVKAVILDIDSPGGTTSGGETIYMAIRRLAEKKPVVASCGTMAASGAYIAAIATDHIVVLGNTLTGSVGVLFQWVNATKLLDTVGVKVESERSGPLKAEPDPFSPTDPQARQAMQELVEDAKQWFFGLVRDRRHIDLASVPGLVQGRVYSGREAVKYKLADQIGDERAALLWLQQHKGISSRLSVVTWEPEAEDQGIWGSVFHSMASAFGMPAGGLAALVGETAPPLQLDGLISLWHATGN